MFRVILRVHTDNQGRVEDVVVYGETAEELAGNAFAAGVRHHQANPGYYVTSTSTEPVSGKEDPR